MRTTLVLLFYFLCSQSFAQNFQNDTFLVKDGIKQSIELYDHFTAAQAAIYNGGEYVPYTFERTGSPFFDSDTLANGDIGYAGRIYHSIPMQYDVARNQVVILNYDRLSKIILQNDIVDSFHFLNYTFIHLNKDPKQNLNSTNLYQLLFNGHIQVLARRKKIFEDTFKEDEILRVFHSEDLFYIHKGDTYYAANNKKDVYSIFKDKQHEIRTLMRQQKIRFGKKNFNEALLAAARIYDQLIH
ncbi:MAG: hypothetical protein ABI863_13805 [Ginsengibacter sp.]